MSEWEREGGVSKKGGRGGGVEQRKSMRDIGHKRVSERGGERENVFPL